MKPENVPAEIVTAAMKAAFPYLQTDRDHVRLESAEKHTRAALAAVWSHIKAYDEEALKKHRAANPDDADIKGMMDEYQVVSDSTVGRMDAVTLAGILRDVAERVLHRDSFHGSIVYELTGRNTDEYNVTAFYRIGNRDGQGSTVMIRGNSQDPETQE